MYVSINSRSGLAGVELGAPFPAALPFRKRGCKARRGMGSLTTTAITSGGQVGGAVVSGNTAGIISAGASGAGAIALALMPAAVATGPIGLAITGAVVAISALSGKIAHLISGCGQVCVQATSIVNEADQAVQQIGSAYWNTAVRTKAFQQYTLGQLDQIFAQVQQMLAQLGTVGAKSAQERFTRGGGAPWCASNNLAIGVDNVVAPNATNHLGRCGGWYDVVYDPIANDSGIASDASLAGAVSSVTSALGLPSTIDGIGIANFILPALLGVGVLWLLE